MTETRRGLLIILSSPSGAGKTTMARRLMAWDRSIAFSVSATTRPPRPGEVDGREYHFLSEADFDALVDSGGMLEHARVFGHCYGSPRAPVEAAVADGRDVIFDIDWQGGQQIRGSPLGTDVVSIFLLPPSIAALEARLRDRAQDSAKVVADRMQKARAEISHWAEYDYVLVNADMEETDRMLQAIITAERLRRSRQPGLPARVRALDTEYAERFG
ncbi:MAG TPA: guanylate kinase [Rhodobacteraceae bacterium]|jgi:guanylate kinase|nr:guanylate kinase [Paracoccaceae bacterium]HBG98976.1 guanylate kinase [Paracoccaceae bacterium]